MCLMLPQPEESPRDVLNRLVRQHFPHGDPVFYEITADELEMYNQKNADYASGSNDPNGNFNRVASIMALYPNLKLSDPRVVALTYMMKQLDQVLFSLHRGFEGKLEGLDARLADIVIYSKIARVINRHIMDVAMQGTQPSVPSDTQDIPFGAQIAAAFAGKKCCGTDGQCCSNRGAMDSQAY